MNELLERTSPDLRSYVVSCGEVRYTYVAECFRPGGYSRKWPISESKWPMTLKSNERVESGLCSISTNRDRV